MYPEQQQKQSNKKRQQNKFLKWLCKPQTLRLLFNYGPTIFNLLKWLIELIKELDC
jgi:hypothetical protein